MNTVPAMRPHDDFCDLLTLFQWDIHVEHGSIMSGDGTGYWATDTERSDVDCWADKPDWATHVAWYNK